jgi:hypothetical protein
MAPAFPIGRSLSTATIAIIAMAGQELSFL